jgi:hypothetical protein
VDNHLVRYSAQLIGKVKESYPWCLAKHHAMQTNGGVEVQIHTLLTSALGSEWSASRPGHFTPDGRTPVSIRDEAMCVSQSRSGRYGEAKNSALPVIEPWSSSS